MILVSFQFSILIESTLESDFGDQELCGQEGGKEKEGEKFGDTERSKAVQKVVRTSSLKFVLESARRTDRV